VNQELLPVLAQRNDMRIVEVDGQPVVTARDLAGALGYSDERTVNRIITRNRESFGQHDLMVVNLTTIQGERNTVVLTKRGAMKSASLIFKELSRAKGLLNPGCRK